MSAANDRREKYQEARKQRKRNREVMTLLGCMVVLVTAFALMIPAISITQDAASREDGFYKADQQMQATQVEPDDSAPGGNAVFGEISDVGVPVQDSNDSMSQDESQGAFDEGATNENPEKEAVKDEEISSSEPSDSVKALGKPASSVSDKAEVGDNDAKASMSKMPAQKLKTELSSVGDGETLTIAVDAPEGALPKGVSMTVEEVIDENVLAAAKETGAEAIKDATGEPDGAIATDESAAADAAYYSDGSSAYVAKVVAVNITFFDADGKEIVPAKDVRVTLGSSAVKKAVKESKRDAAVALVHLDDKEIASMAGVDKLAQVGEYNPVSVEDAKRAADVVASHKVDVDRTRDEVAFEASDFSVYAVVYTVDTYFRSYTGDTFKITLDYDQNAGIPVGAELKVREILPEHQGYQEYLDQAMATAAEDAAADPIDSDYARFFDIEIWSDGAKVEPTAPVSVSIELADAAQVSDVEALRVVHFGAEGPEVVEGSQAAQKDDGSAELAFVADSFSVYGVIVDKTAPSGANDLDGYTVKMSNRNYFLGSQNISGNPNGISKTADESAAAEWTFESAGSAGRYYIYTEVDGVKQYINISPYSGNEGHATLSTTRQELTVTKNGENYVIGRSVNGLDLCINHWGSGSSNKFAAYNGRSNSDAQLKFTFTEELLENDDEYMVLVNQTAADGEDDWYIVLNDGKLAPVEYDEATGKVKVDNPMLWHYTGDHLYHHSKEVGFKGNNLPSDYYYKYIDPTSTSGLNEDNSSNTTQRNGDGPYIVQNGRQLWNGTALTYSNHQVKSANSNQYIGVNQDTTAIVGRVPQGSAAEIYLAKVTEVPESSNKNHTVNHIDISIKGGATLDVPLAYGDYYYYDEHGVKQTLTVSANNNVTLNLKEDSVDIKPEDMKNSEITAYSEKSGVLNDAFYVSGYSGNRENTVSTAQVRIEGSFKVADLDPYDNLWMNGDDEQGLTDQQLQDRLDNRIYYTVTVKKEVTFDWLYTYKDEQGREHTVQLYDADNNKLSSKSLINLSKSFDYWDGVDSPHWNGIENYYNDSWGNPHWGGENNPYIGNECPPIIEIDPVTHVQQWKKGHIVYNTSGETGSGMDFKLEAHAISDSNPAIEITKTLLTDTGEVLKPKSPVTNTFVVYQKANSNQDDYDGVIDVGIGEGEAPMPDGLYNGYSGIHAKTVTVGQSGEGLVYDYDVKPGMTYITEDAQSIHREIVDQDGKRWKYVKTSIDTEYAWRQDGDEDKLHHADGLTSIPEVVGPYNNGLKNGFLPFYVYNVYERADDTVTLPVTKTWDDFAGTEYEWQVTFRLQYMERYVSGDGNSNAVTEWTDCTAENTEGLENGVVTLTKEAGSNKWSVTGSFGDLPKHRTGANGNVYERQYSADEVSFTVWKNGQLLYGYDGEEYSFGEDADESIYKPFYDHDANENWDGDWHLQISNSVGQKIEPRTIDINLQKKWVPSVPENAKATFTLKRYKQTEFVDYQNVENNSNIEVQLKTPSGVLLSNVLTKSGINVYIDATFAPGKTGTLTFQYAGNNYTVSNETASDSKVTVRSDPIPIPQELNNGATVDIRLIGGDLENLAEGNAYNVRITDRTPGNQPALDTFSSEITFPIDGKTGAEAWQYVFKDLPVEEGVWNSAGNHAEITIYSYFLEEETPEGYLSEIVDSDGNVISSGNRMYNTEAITATNIETTSIKVKKQWLTAAGNLDASNTGVISFTLNQTAYDVESETSSPEVPYEGQYENEIVGNGEVVIENLPLYGTKDGKRVRYEYTIHEDESTVPGYHDTYSISDDGTEWTIYNTPVADTDQFDNLAVTKMWQKTDGTNDDGDHSNDEVSFTITRHAVITDYVPVTLTLFNSVSNGVPAAVKTYFVKPGTNLTLSFWNEDLLHYLTFSGVGSSNGNYVGHVSLMDNEATFTVTDAMSISAQIRDRTWSLLGILTTSVNDTWVDNPGQATSQPPSNKWDYSISATGTNTLYDDATQLAEDIKNGEQLPNQPSYTYAMKGGDQISEGATYDPENTDSAFNPTATNWVATLSQLPVYAKIGDHYETYTYTVSEYTVNGEEVVFDQTDSSKGSTDDYLVTVDQENKTITNRAREKIDVDASKAWINADSTTTAPIGASVTFELFVGDTATGKTVVLNGKTDVATYESMPDPDDGMHEVNSVAIEANAYESQPWKAVWKDLPKYDVDNVTPLQYKVKEVAGLDGYTNLDPNGVSYTSQNRTITNQQVSTAINILKVDSENPNDHLTGAAFVLKQYRDGYYSVIRTWPQMEVSSEEGKEGTLEISGLSVGNYELDEAVMPPGYVKSSVNPRFTVVQNTQTGVLEVVYADNTDGAVTYETSSNTFTVRNTPGTPLPVTGGPGTTMLLIIGSMLVCIGAVTLGGKARRGSAARRIRFRR